MPRHLCKQHCFSNRFQYRQHLYFHLTVTQHVNLHHSKPSTYPQWKWTLLKALHSDLYNSSKKNKKESRANSKKLSSLKEINNWYRDIDLTELWISKMLNSVRKKKVIVFNSYLAFFKAIEIKMMVMDKRTDNYRENCYWQMALIEALG